MIKIRIFIFINYFYIIIKYKIFCSRYYRYNENRKVNKIRKSNEIIYL